MLELPRGEVLSFRACRQLAGLGAGRAASTMQMWGRHGHVWPLCSCLMVGVASVRGLPISPVPRASATSQKGIVDVGVDDQ